jgi:circadian clock protein KaiB
MSRISVQNPPEDETDAIDETYLLKLYITGMTPLSQSSIANAKRLCEEHLGGRYRLEVIDLFQQPEQAQGAQITAVPTLIRESPPPLRRVVGDLSDTQHVLIGLDLPRRTK